LTAKPWDKDPHFFKDIKISALALLKMVMHARSEGLVRQDIVKSFRILLHSSIADLGVV
jgi:hypothetical protein